MLAQPFHFYSLEEKSMKGLAGFIGISSLVVLSFVLQFSHSSPAQRNNLYDPGAQKTPKSQATSSNNRKRLREKWRKRSSYGHYGDHHYHWTTPSTTPMPMTTTQPQESEAEKKVREKATLFIKSLPISETEQAFNSSVYLFSDAVLAVANITGDFMTFPLTILSEGMGVLNEVVKQVFYKPVVGFLNLTPLKGLDGAIRGYLALNGITITPDPPPTMMPTESSTAPPLTAPHENSLNYYNHHQHLHPVHNYEYINY